MGYDEIYETYQEVSKEHINRPLFEDGLFELVRRKKPPVDIELDGRKQSLLSLHRWWIYRMFDKKGSGALK